MIDGFPIDGPEIRVFIDCIAHSLARNTFPDDEEGRRRFLRATAEYAVRLRRSRQLSEPQLSILEKMLEVLAGRMGDFDRGDDP